MRRDIARLFDGGAANRIVLAPGILSALRQLFPAVGVQRLALTTEEYYGARHFPAIRVTSGPAATIGARMGTARPQALIMSVVSWRGEPLPVAETFAAIRAQSARPPLLIADYTHAGAVGFPPIAALNADLVCGDAAKWLLPPGPSRLAFIWIRSPALFRSVRPSFTPLFLAVDGTPDPRSARWVDPLEVGRIARWLIDSRTTRRQLVAQYQANIDLKRELAETMGIDSSGESSVIWTTARLPARLRTQLESRGLLWRTGRHLRILCRAEMNPLAS